jgi:hypothetical protein
MPEAREEEAHFFWFKELFDKLKETSSFTLMGLFADAATAEERLYDAQDGQVMRLNANCKILRGTASKQTPLWPEKFAYSPENPNPLPLSELTLQEAHQTSRGIVLDFGTYFLKVSYLLLFDTFFIEL